jgi:hypothetical protein
MLAPFPFVALNDFFQQLLDQFLADAPLLLGELSPHFDLREVEGPLTMRPGVVHPYLLMAAPDVMRRARMRHHYPTEQH